MKLLIHAGLHKTATTTFQRICNRHADGMLVENVCFPKVDRREGHNWMIWELTRGNPGPCEDWMQECSSLLGRDGTAILSAEDLENCLLDVRTAQRLEDIALRNGATTIEWFFVRRESQAYLQSTYAEMSKHGASFDFAQFAAAAESLGFTCCPSPTYNFLLFNEPERFVDDFRSSVRGGVTLVDFDAFVDPFPGHVLLSSCLPASLLEAMREDYAKHRHWENRRSHIAAIEFRHTCNFLGIGLGTASRVTRFLLFIILSPLIFRRMRNYSRYIKRMQTRNDSVWPRTVGNVPFG